MERLFYFICSIMLITSCAQSSKKIGSADVQTDSVTADTPGKNSSLYAQVDSVFRIDAKTFRVLVKQYDLTEVAAAAGDTLSRPTYACSVKIFDDHGKIIFTDSLLRDSWSYPGKIVSIDSYQIAMPQLQRTGSEIILLFNIFEQTDGDAIQGSIAFNVKARKARYYWQEALPGE